MENVNSDLIRGNIDTIILRCLNLGDMYGLEICNHIKQASSGDYVLKQPTLYSALKRLEGKGLISSYWQDSAIGGRRHYYRLTETGRQSFVGRKNQWSASKEVIDNLVEEKEGKIKKFTKQPVLPVDDVFPAPAALQNTVTTGMPISPYNPFNESADDYLTLPFRIIENEAERTKTASKQENPIAVSSVKKNSKDDIPPLLKFVLNDTALASIPEPSAEVKDAQKANVFAKYISPDDHAITTVNASLCAKTARITNYDIEIRPFVKHSMDKKRGDFHFAGKLRFIAAFVVTLAIIACLVIAQYNLKPNLQDYTADENFFFVLGYTFAVLYFIYYFVRFCANPQSKKALKSYTGEHFIRLVTFIGAVITILAINVLTGLTSMNSADYLVYWVVPCILAAAVYAEGIVQFLLRKTKIFVA